MKHTQPHSMPLDVYFAFAVTDFPRVLPLARHLANHGYRVGPRRALDLPPTSEPEPTSADAACVLLVWSKISETSAALHYEARTAAARHALAEIRTAKNPPQIRYTDKGAIDFSKWDETTRERPWRELLNRLRPICGAPPQRALDMVEFGPVVVMLALAGISMGVGLATLTQRSPVEASEPAMASSEEAAEAAVADAEPAVRAQPVLRAQPASTRADRDARPEAKPRVAAKAVAKPVAADASDMPVSARIGPDA